MILLLIDHPNRSLDDEKLGVINEVFSLNFLKTLECSECGDTFTSDEVHTYCEKCDAPLLAKYDLEAAKRKFTKSDLLGRKPTMWRYAEVLPICKETNVVSLGEGMTPVHELTDTRINKELGIERIFVKDDGVMPTGSFKARGLSAAVSKAKELGVKRVAIPSAGNAAGALSTYGAKAGMEVVVVMPKNAPLACILESYMAGAKVFLVHGSISDAGKIIREGKSKFNWFDVSTTKEPYRVEGKKSMGLELAEQFNWDLPDLIIYPTGGGTGIIGMWKAFQELAELGWIEPKFPKMVAVQSKGCAPLVEAFRTNERYSNAWEDPRTMAGGIRVPKAFGDFLVMDTIYESGGFAVSVSDQAIAHSAQVLSQEGLFPCPEGAATLAGLKTLKNEGKVKNDEEVLLYNTGAGIKYAETFSEIIEFDLPIISKPGEIEL